METWALLAHQAYENLLEFFVSKSDSLAEGARLLKYLYDNAPERYTPFTQKPGILSVFEVYLNASGYSMDEINESDKNKNVIQLTCDNVNEDECITLDVTQELKILESDDD